MASKIEAKTSQKGIEKEIRFDRCLKSSWNASFSVGAQLTTVAPARRRRWRGPQAAQYQKTNNTKDQSVRDLTRPGPKAWRIVYFLMSSKVRIMTFKVTRDGINKQSDFRMARPPRPLITQTNILNVLCIDSLIFIDLYM